ncbi:MAG: (d)CMP kinase, partial [Bifidobacterium sp.]|nr:(d)CMP kinase [Bifidobacterium sp.]
MITVAIDGPAGVGKSSTSRALAKHFGRAYLDTGAMYRAVTLWCMDRGLDLDADQPDQEAITEAVADSITGGHLVMGLDPEHPTVSLDDRDVDEEIRSTSVSEHVSAVSSIPAVRRVLIAAQRAIMADQERGVVAEGRDITTVVAPDAQVRVLLTAREEVRQARRSGQAQSGSAGAEDLAARDARDSKVTSFMSAADG